MLVMWLVLVMTVVCVGNDWFVLVKTVVCVGNVVCTVMTGLCW